MSPDIYDSIKYGDVNPKEVLDNYEPSEEQLHRLNTLIDVVKKSDEEDLETVLLGGYALDGLYGRITRPHDDIDILIGDGQEGFEKFKNILEGLGYHSDNLDSDEEKDVFRNDMDPNFKVEFAALSALNDFITEDENIELYIPKEDNASLNGQTFKALTLYGCKRAIEIQNDRSKERNWGEYPEEKRNNQKLLIEFLEKKEEEKNVQ